MSDETSRRSFLWATGLAAVSFGAGIPIAKCLSSSHGHHEADEGEGPRWAMVVDTKKCSQADGCTACSKACHEIHNVPEIDNPEEAVKWIWQSDFEGAGLGHAHEFLSDEVKNRQVPVLCNHCDNPPCVRVCPTQATWKRKDGIVMMDMHRCIGCRYCIVGCPYGARSFNFSDPRPHVAETEFDFPTRSKGVVEKCNFCAEKARFSKDGTWTPECVAKCPEGALIWGDIRDESSEVRKVLAERFTVQRKSELGTRPHVFYVL